MEIKIKIEKWKNGTKYVLRDPKGKFISSTDKKNFKTKALANEYLSKNKTLAPNTEKLNKKYKITKVKGFTTYKEKLTNVEMITKTKQTEIESRFDKPSRATNKNAMYVVSADITYYHPETKKILTSTVSASSPRLSSGITPKAAKQTAWENFFKRVSQFVYGNKYDDDEGRKFLEEFGYSNLEEGWRYYKVLK